MDTVVATIRQRPRGGALILDGNFNADLVVPEGDKRDKYIT